MASPIKRRVLAPLDANTPVSASPMSVAGKPAASESKLPLSPPSSAIAKKRTLPETSLDNETADSTTPLKKTCLASESRIDASPTSLPRDTKQQAQQEARQVPTSTSPVAAIVAGSSRPSLSPTTSSVFDLSAMVDTSQATNITEPDVEAPRPTLAFTREQSRQRAEILKLRLSLARYKVRTGQVDVPLEQLRVVPAATLQQRQQNREWSASEWVRQQQQEQKHMAGSLAGSSQPRQQPPLPQRWALWGPASSSTGGAPGSRGRDQAMSVSQTSSSDEEEDDEDEEGDLPQLPQIRRLSPTKKWTSRHNLLTTPRGNRLLVDDGDGSHLDGLTSSAMRGSAVNGLLSLARS
ncbi:hypothetical protein Sste5346_002887 [Sporothrix stenoceras]|uniref:Uncharacterized protein n=1 Tax=Sporothrix stenoceras TaxID=5173 RepID=A0ABR3ZI41_9PEZI